MELKKAIKKIDKLTDTEKELWLERCDELKGQGMSEEEIADQIIIEMREDADNDLAQLKKGLGKK
jgi:uncharacterized protein YoaH (UPF0181 family)